MTETAIKRPSLSKAFIEAEYNNRSRVPTYADILTRWQQTSLEAREKHKPTTHRFGAQLESTLDLFSAPNPRALLIFIHGGYWRALTKDDFSFIAPAFVGNRISVAIMSYDLCPNTTIGGIIDQIVSGLHYLERVPRVPDRWLIAGHSAGGHLTASMWSPLAKLSPGVKNHIAGGLSISGVHDLDPMVDYAINDDLRLTRGEAHRLSPLAYLPRLDAPLMVAAGGDESSEFQRQAKALHDAWPAVCQHNKAGLHFPVALNHFTVMDKFCDPAHMLYRRMVDMLETK